MRRNWISAALVVAGLSVAGMMAATSAEDGKPGAVLPPPSLFDDAPAQVRAVESPTGLPAPAVVAAKPAPVSVEAQASLPDPILLHSAQPPQAVWWKPWTWFSRRAAPQQVVEPTPAPRPANTAEGYALDSPSKIIRSGMGTCLKTGSWEGAAAGDCDSAMAQQEPAVSVSPPLAAAMEPAPSAVPPNPVVVSALAAEREISRQPLAETDRFDSVRGASENQTGGAAQRDARAKRNPAEVKSEEMIEVTGRGADKPLSMSSEALFAFKSAKLLWAGKKQLDGVAAQLADGDYQSIRVVGHSDKIGKPDRNKKLSLRRAQAVKEYLVVNGAEPDRIVIHGRGADEPVTRLGQCDGLAIQARRACLAPDRRVEIVVTRALAKNKPDVHAARQ